MPLGGGPLGQETLEDAPRHPHHTVVFTYFDTELPLGGLWQAGWEKAPQALSCSKRAIG